MYSNLSCFQNKKKHDKHKLYTSFMLTRNHKTTVDTQIITRKESKHTADSLNHTKITREECNRGSIKQA